MEKSSNICTVDTLTHTISIYNNIAKEYAETWFDDPSVESSLEKFIKLIGKQADVLDAGCGCGRDVNMLRFQGLDVTGVDLSTGMISEARQRVSGGIFRKMDIRKLHYPPEVYTGIWACAVLVHFTKEEAGRALKELSRVLRPNGLLSLAVEYGEGEFYDHLGRFRKLYSSNLCRDLLQMSGFSVLEERTVKSNKVTFRQSSERKWLEIIAYKNRQYLEKPINNESDNCMLCPTARFNVNRRLGIPGASSILWGDCDLFIIPDVAPLMEGHLLLVTAHHYRCYGATPVELQYKIIVALNRISTIFQEAYGKPALFIEHGPSRRKRAGACIDHAHWHCLPTSYPIEKSVAELLGSGQPASIESLRDIHESGQSYIFIGDATGRGSVVIADVLPSQFLRQIVISFEEQREWRWQDACKNSRNQDLFRQGLERLLPLTDRFLSENVV